MHDHGRTNQIAFCIGHGDDPRFDGNTFTILMREVEPACGRQCCGNGAAKGTTVWEHQASFVVSPLYHSRLPRPSGITTRLQSFTASSTRTRVPGAKQSRGAYQRTCSERSGTKVGKFRESDLVQNG